MFVLTVDASCTAGDADRAGSRTAPNALHAASGKAECLDWQGAFRVASAEAEPG